MTATLPETSVGATKAARMPFDAVAVLTVYLVLLLAIPSALTIKPLGSIGSPATLWAIVATGLWFLTRLHSQPVRVTRHRLVRTMVLVLLVVVAISYAVAMTRGPLPDEVSIADTGLLRIIGLGGLCLLAADGIPSVERLRVLARRVVLGGALMALLGIAQFVTRRPLIDAISFPGMSVDTAYASDLGERGGFVRAAATAVHPLEYGVVLCIALPIAIALALEDRQRSALRRWTPVVLLAIAAALSVSRSAYIGLIVGLVMLLPAWTPARRIGFAIVGGLSILAMTVVVPGLFGAIRGLFQGVGSDSSTVSRLSGFDIAGAFVSRSPLFGKGYGTLLPRYHIFDNELLLLVCEIGLVGLAAFVALVMSGIVSGARARRLFTAELDRQLAQSFTASILAAGLLMAFFDGLSFKQSGGLLFLVIGIAGATLRLASASRTPDA